MCLFIAFTSMAGMFSCDESGKTGATYYPLDSLFQAQEILLSKTGARLNKSSVLDQKHDSTSYVPKDIAEWKKELDVLHQLTAINKPVNRGFYTSGDHEDTKSNLRIRIFEAQKPELPVQYLKIYYLDTPDRVRRIEGSYVETNELYESSRLIFVELQEIYNKTLITSYSVKGTQRMIFTDSFDFTVEGKIRINQH